MNRLLNTLTLVLLTAGAPALAAEDAGGAAGEIAAILVDMNHFPSTAEKEALSAIAADASVDEDLQAIAEAVAGIEHTPSAAAQAELNGIVTSESTSAAEKTLAGAVLRFEHAVAAEDRSALEALASR